MSLNENTEIVKKVWENKNGSTLANPPTDSIKVTVYRQEQQLAKWMVSTVNYCLKDKVILNRKIRSGSGSHFSIAFGRGQYSLLFYREEEKQLSTNNKIKPVG